jgi:hypothetical protein
LLQPCASKASVDSAPASAGDVNQRTQIHSGKTQSLIANP